MKRSTNNQYQLTIHKKNTKHEDSKQLVETHKPSATMRH